MISDLVAAAPFYQNQKTVFVFFFINDRLLSDRASDAQTKIREFFNGVVGNDVSITVNCLFNHKLKEASALVMSFGAFPRELLDGIMRYVSESFLSGQEEAFESFRDNVINLIGGSRSRLTSSEITERERKMSDFFRDISLPEEETLSPEAADVISNVKSFKEVVGDKGVSQYLVKRQEVKECFDKIISFVAIKPNFDSGVDQVL
jgi:hypothetical protein